MTTLLNINHNNLETAKTLLNDFLAVKEKRDAVLFLSPKWFELDKERAKLDSDIWDIIDPMGIVDLYPNETDSAKMLELFLFELENDYIEIEYEIVE